MYIAKEYRNMKAIDREGKNIVNISTCYVSFEIEEWKTCFWVSD